MNLELKEFDINKLKKDSTIAIVAKRRSGKSFLCRDILYNHKDIPAGIVISPTEKANKFYGDFIPPSFIYDEYDENIVDNLIKRQSKLLEKNSNKMNAFLIMDDCMHDNKWVKHKSILNIFMNGRHYKLLFVLLMQFALGIPPSLRTNIDYIFLLKEPIFSNKKRLYEHYAGMFPSFDIFSQVMDRCTENFECLVIDNTSRSTKIEDQVFWYKAVQRNEFRMGHNIYWNFHKKKYNPTKKMENDLKDVFLNSKPKQKIIIKKLK